VLDVSWTIEKFRSRRITIASPAAQTSQSAVTGPERDT
jgi:hypothetical protein